MHPNPIITDSYWVMDHAQHLTIDKHNITALADQLINQGLTYPDWTDIPYYRGKPEQTVQAALIREALNFCTWVEPDQVQWTYQTNELTYTGWYATVLAINHEIDHNPYFLDAQHLADLTQTVFDRMFSGQGTLPLTNQRRHHINQIGQVLQDNFKGQFANLLKQADNNALKAVELTTTHFPNFVDQAEYQGKTITFNKRAQHLTASIWGLFAGQGLGKFTNIDQLTAFADHAIPQLLYHFNILKYDNQLEQQIQTHKPISSGSPQEIEIRAATIVAVDQLCQQLNARKVSIIPIQLDVNLWLLANQLKDHMAPHHRTRTTNY
jgi:hypothetical protein